MRAIPFWKDPMLKPISVLCASVALSFGGMLTGSCEVLAFCATVTVLLGRGLYASRGVRYLGALAVVTAAGWACFGQIALWEPVQAVCRSLLFAALAVWLFLTYTTTPERLSLVLSLRNETASTAALFLHLLLPRLKASAELVRLARLARSCEQTDVCGQSSIIARAKSVLAQLLFQGLEALQDLAQAVHVRHVELSLLVAAFQAGEQRHDCGG